ncbi:RNA-directed DNA polymerase, eukaryota [Tanacetum coccineum]
MAPTNPKTKHRPETTKVGEEVLDLVIPYIHNVEDRSSVSLVSRKFYEIDGITRKRLTVHTLYYPNPASLSKRFPFIEALTLKGPPSGFNRRCHHHIKITPWIQQLALEFRSLKELHLRGVVVFYEDLETWGVTDWHQSSLGYRELGKFTRFLGGFIVNVELAAALENRGLVPFALKGYQWWRGSHLVFDRLDTGQGFNFQFHKKEDTPAIVLDETYANKTDYSLALLGKAKDFTSLTNLNVVLANEGFVNVKLKYIGGFGVMIVFTSKVQKETFSQRLRITPNVEGESDLEEVAETIFEKEQASVEVKEETDVDAQKNASKVLDMEGDNSGHKVQDVEQESKQTWNDAQVTDSNAISMFMKKMKYLKEKIRMWVKANKENSKSHKQCLQEELSKIDLLLDKGEGSSTLISKRMEILKSIQDFVKLDTMELAQKAKIKWAIEGDENLKYYHGVLNKKRNQLAICGILVEGRWIESPILVKDEFLSYFASRFNKPPDYRLHIDLDFPNKLSLEQQMVLEIEVTREEIKKAVWDCGVDKSPGPDGFTFGFYRRYWTFLEDDVVEAVLYFFNHGQFPKGLDLVRSGVVGSKIAYLFQRRYCESVVLLRKFRVPLRPIAKVILTTPFLVSFDHGEVQKFGCLMSRIQPRSEKIVNKILTSLSKMEVEDLIDPGLRGKANYSRNTDPRKESLEFRVHLIIELFYSNGFGVSAHNNQLYGPKLLKGYREDGKIGTQFESHHAALWVGYREGELSLEDSTKYFIGGLSYQFMMSLLCSFRRAPRAGAEELQYIQLVKIMEGITLFDSKDRWRWSLKGCGEFTVASVRNLLDANSLPVVSSKTRWIKAVPIKVNIQYKAWKLKLDHLPTRLETISIRGMILIDSMVFYANRNE